VRLWGVLGVLGLLTWMAPACLGGKIEGDVPLGGAAGEASGGDHAAGGGTGGTRATGGAKSTGGAPSGGAAGGGEATQGGAAGAGGALGAAGSAGAPGCEPYDWEVPAGERFVARWEVGGTLTLPVHDDVDFVVDWGDCTHEHITSSSDSITHQYEEPGIYQVEVGGNLGTWTFSTLECVWIDEYDGACMEGWHEGHSLSELREILRWGTFPPIGRYSFHAEYDPCNITISAEDAPIVEADAYGMFWGCEVAGDLSHWDMSAVTNLSDMFYRGHVPDLNVSGWDVSSVENADSMFSSSSLSVENYDALLLSWSAQTVLPGVSFGAGQSQYSVIAVEARALLGASWTIHDGGLAP
jgi:hypothetical protein